MQESKSENSVQIGVTVDPKTMKVLREIQGELLRDGERPTVSAAFRKVAHAYDDRKGSV